MAVIKIGISKEINNLRREFNDIMDELFRIPYGALTSSSGWVPAIDIYADSSFVYVVADLAGVEADSLELVLEGQFLRMSGHRKPPLAIKEKRFFQMEVEYGPFERIVRIPLPVEADDIKAKMENGLLLVCFTQKENKGNDLLKIEIK
ncbi:MAG: Hsp20/alpha crystallin family protein [Thermodesulfobacteria bacterium]|nr:Hsp20/alpha crystallin family protein [Thermodesulfobacteriota bacterium]